MSRSTSPRLRRVVLAGALAGGLVAGGTPAYAAEPADIGPFCAEAPDTSRFTDAGGFFSAEIACLEATEITRGVTPELYLPERAVTRGEMASFVVRLVDTAVALQTVELNPLPDAEDEYFTDVDPDSPHADAINRLAESGIVEGGVGGAPDDQFGPDLPVNRAHIATMLAGAYIWLTGEDVGDDTEAFTDIAGLDPQVQADINALASAGVTAGVGGGRYAPADPVRRGQMAAFLTRLLAVLHADEFIEPLTPMEFLTELEELNGSGATGAVLVTALGGEATVEMIVEGVSPGQPHAQHVHIGGTNSCPTEEADADDNGFVNVAEGVPFYGGIAVSLTTTGAVTPASALDVDRFPLGDDEGAFDYARSFTLPGGLVASDLAAGVIVVHGIADTTLGEDPDIYDGPDSEIAAGVPSEATLPAACGALE